MRLEVFREYCVLAKRLNYAKAARELHMSPSTLSVHVSQLEKEIGFPLLNEGGKSSLTYAGRAFLDGVEKLLSEYDELVDYCAALAVEAPVELRVGVSPFNEMFSTQFKARLLCAYGDIKERHPSLDLRFVPIPQRKSERECLEEGVVDVILRPELEGYEADAGGGRAVLVDEQEIVVWMDRRHPCASQEALVIGDLVRSRIVLPSNLEVSWYNEVVQQLLTTGGFVPHRKIKHSDTLIDYLIPSTGRIEDIYLLPKCVIDQLALAANSRMVTRSLEDCPRLRLMAVRLHPHNQDLTDELLDLMAR